MQARSVVAAVLLSALGVPVLAQTQASVMATGFSYSLKDLESEDGVTPSLSWNAIPGMAITSYEQQQRGWIPWSDGPDLVSDWSELSNTLATSHGSHLAAFTSMGMGQSSADANGDLFAAMQVPTGYSGNVAAEMAHAFTLSAGTEVSFSYIVSGSASGPGYDGALGSSGAFLMTNRSDAGFVLQMSVGSVFSYLHRGDDTFWNGQSDPYDVNVGSQTVTLTLRNSGVEARTYLLDVIARVEVSDVMAPVPEPASYALMALGLVAVSAAAKRRRG